ncbi:hypothetical protein FisN_26Lh068 [Fistulifera solaris]|uniref:Uncharacterized protein n=1 Tax=Fistulifera solaris TaxID=1519565 RepID=A0A1Z5KCL3_FISSO|nr:hypothetical protein FisN_26Lh068 [Fistulifera solaris]|eukprot:GAX24003.1 hypothetical protein FisN_26Lh068 [Fistulifera solaris]
MKRNSRNIQQRGCLLHAFGWFLLYTALRVFECPIESSSSSAILYLERRPPELPYPNNNSTCSTLLQHSSALALWTQHISQIVSASRLPPDRDFVLRNKVTELLRLVTPRLPLSQSTMTRQWSTLERLQHKLERGEEISIVVLGGSVTMGVNCFTVKTQMRNCAWPYRLEQFLQQMGLKTVKVYNFAIAGSNTATGTALLSFLSDYYILPQPPDIIINAYATNDMHVQSILQAQSSNRTLHELVFDMSQEFVRAALSCGQPPLLIWVDDYLGNEQPEILATTALTQSIHVLSQYYGFSFLSYANLARDLVYGDTHESVFSPGKWYTSSSSSQTKMQREIHPSQSMHMVTAWLVAYHFLVLTTQTCTLESWQVHDYERTLNYHDHSIPPGLSPLETDESRFPRWPKMPRPVPSNRLPPKLTPDLTLEQVTDLWRSNETKSSSACSTKCPFVWVSGLSLHHPPLSAKAEYRAIQSLFQKVLVSSSWTLMDDTKRGDKLGWMPDSLGSKMVLQLPTTAPTQMTLFYLKSYGPKWEHSTVQVSMESMEGPHSFSLTGFHDKKTSEMYIHTVEPGTYSKMTVKLVQGTTFKLMGVAMCHDENKQY